MLRLRQYVTEPRVLLATVLILAIGTRFYQLGTESFWLDEAITFHRAKLPLSELVADAWRTYHNPAYFIGIHYWMKLGDNEFVLRLPSAICGVFTILCAYRIGQIVAGNWAGLGAALVLSLNPKSLEYDQEARMYAPYSLGAAAAMYGIVWLFSHPTDAAFPVVRMVKDAAARAANAKAARAWAAIALGSIVALYCHATAVLFVTACSLVALLFIAFRPERRGFLVNWIVVNLLVVLVFLPWLPSLFTQGEEMTRRGFWVPDVSSARVVSAIRAVLCFGGWRYRWLPYVVLAFALVGSFALRKKPLLLAALWLFTLLGPGLLWLASLRQSIFMPRLILWSAIPAAVLVGAGLGAWKWPVVRGVCLIAFLGVAGYALHRGYYVATTKPRWRNAVELLSKMAAPNVRILAIARREKRLLQYYFERRTDSIPEFEYVAMEGSNNRELDEAIGQASTVWTVQGRQTPMANEIRARLKERGRREEHAGFGEGVLVERYLMSRKKNGKRK